jgi:hypothetical protein
MAEEPQEVTEITEDFKQGMLQGTIFAANLIKHLLIEKQILNEADTAFFKKGTYWFYKEDGSKGTFNLEDAMDIEIKKGK